VSEHGQRRGGQRHGAIALAIAVSVHATGLAWVARTWDHESERAAASAPGERKLADAVPVGSDLAVVELVDDGERGLPVVTVDGAGDDTAFDSTHPFPDADVDFPGDAPAARGGGSDGGTESITGRRDPDTARAQTWNHPDRYRLARARSAASSSTPESISRDREPGIADRMPRRARARAGRTASQLGTDDGRGDRHKIDGVPERDWQEIDPAPTLDDPRAIPARADGATRTGRDRPLSDRGEQSVESDRRGAARDRDTTASASHERDPAPLEMSTPSAGGLGDSGVAGRRPESGVSRKGRGGKTAATRARVPRASGRISVRAHRLDAYFRKMYEQVDRVLVYPRDLALSLEQGEVVVRFTLHRDGSIADIAVAKSSGFKEFDRAFTRALRRAAPFGMVPTSVRGDASNVTVKAPYTFSNPIIR